MEQHAQEIEAIRRQTIMMALELNVKGLMNVQYALKDGKIYILEVNPRASRTAPFVSKATGRPLAKIAARVMAGRSLKELGVFGDIVPSYYSVKEAVFPFAKFPGVDTILGPEMKSTGEVMGIGDTFAEAFAKAQLGANVKLPLTGNVFISVRDIDKKYILNLENSALTYMADRQAADADATLTLTRAALDAIMAGLMTLEQAVASGSIKSAGNGKKVVELFSLLDTFKPDFNIVVP